MLLFFAVGIGMLIGGVYHTFLTWSFVETAMRGEGEVIRLEGDTDGVYYPVVQFTTKQGERIEFRSRSGSYPPSHDVGERVDVFYEENNAQNARIDSFFNVWGGGSILTGLGMLFAAVPVGTWISQRKKRRYHASLREQGQMISTSFIRGEIDSSFKVNGRSGYRVLTEGKDPKTGSVRSFQSERVWSDPGIRLTPGQSIPVYLDPQDPQKYFVDIESVGL